MYAVDTLVCLCDCFFQRGCCRGGGDDTASGGLEGVVCEGRSGVKEDDIYPNLVMLFAFWI